MSKCDSNKADRSKAMVSTAGADVRSSPVGGWPLLAAVGAPDAVTSEQSEVAASFGMAYRLVIYTS